MLILSYQVDASGFHARIPENLKVLSWRTDFYPSVIPGRNFSRLDNHNDAVMTQIALDNPSVSRVEAALNPMIVRGFVDEIRNIPNQVKSLEARYYDDVEPAHGFGRYWNGYAPFIRVFGSIFSYQQLRVFNYLCMGILMGLACYFINRTLDRNFMYAFILCLVATSIYLVPLSLQYISCFYIMFSSIIALCWLVQRYGKDAPVLELLALSAIATAYFDLLTAPLVVVGTLTILYAGWLYRDRSLDGSKIMGQLMVLGFSWWGIYAAFWATKPIVARLFSVGGVGADASATFMKYFTHASPSDWIHATFYNIATLMGATSMDVNVKDYLYWLYVVAFFIALAFSVVLWVWVIKRQGQVVDSLVIKRYLPLLAVAITPFLWWEITPWRAANHIFTYREIAVFLFGLAAFYILTYYEVRAATVQGQSRLTAPQPQDEDL